MKRHLHLDLVGGLSGDMFISGMLDAFPEWRAAWQSDLQLFIDDAGFPDMVSLKVDDHDDGTLTGTRFTVTTTESEGHHHRHFREIRETIERSALPDSVKQIALDIFTLIAEVEAAIHGKKVADVAFHEVGAWDSIADIVLAAALIDRAEASSWSISGIPVGRGWVETAHGRLPVPAPATAKLLEGFEVIDDGLEGERVTPTGAAIIRFLNPSSRIPAGSRLGQQGYGFGTKRFPGISNVVRVSRYEDASPESAWDNDVVGRLSFEVDDQTPESLADSVERLRAHEKVIDVTQQAFWGKKNRQGFSISLLARPEDIDDVIGLVFEHTSTLGVRRELIDRAVLPRQEVVVYVGERAYRVKVARRPSGYTAKVEMDDLLAAGLSREEQERVRVQAEQLAIEQVE